jgi:hypothetical protein
MFQSLVGRKATLVSGLIAAITLASTVGKLKNGTTAPYLTLTPAEGEAISLHPRKATTLFSKGEVDGIKLLIDSVAADAGTKTEAADAVPAKPAKVAKVKVAKVYKKATAMAIFDEVSTAKGTRAEVIARFIAELPCSKNCANTYYSNIVLSKAGW